MIGTILLAMSASMQIKAVEALWFNSSNSVDGNGTFECNANISLHCKSQATPPNIKLRINGIQAVACSSMCFVSSSALGRYTVDHNSTIGIINLHITSVTDKDQHTTFTCEENALNYAIQPKIIVNLKNDAQMNVSVVGKNVQINVTTSCVLEAGNVSFHWTKMRKGASQSETLSPETFFQSKNLEDNSLCDSKNNCGANGMLSVLNFMEVSEGTGQDYYIQCEILVLDQHAAKNALVLVSDITFHLEASSSSTASSTITTSDLTMSTTVTDTTTISTASSTPSLPTSSIEHNTSSNSTGISVTTKATPAKQHKQYADDTSTILIAAFSSMAGIMVFLIVVFVINKVRKRHNTQSDETNMQTIQYDKNIK